MTLVFHNQPIINRGETLTCIYKLIRGTASVLDPRGMPALTLKSPIYLNLPEVIYDSPAGKTVRAQGRCEVMKVRPKDVHKKVIRKLKDDGLRKAIFPVFEAVPSSFFYSLMHYTKLESIEKGKFVGIDRGNIYLIVEGSVFVSKDGKTKLVRLEKGQTLMVTDPGTSLFAESDKIKVAVVSISTAQLLLAQHFLKIKRHGDSQRELLDTYENRNSRISADFKRSRQGSTREKSSIPKEFINKIQAKVDRFDQYKRARSCFASCRLDPQQIRQENQKKYLQVMDLNRLKFGQEYAYRKRMQINRDVHSLSHGRKAQSLTQNQLDVSIYQVFSLKAHYGVLKRHPQAVDTRHRKQGLIKRTAALKRNFISLKNSRTNSITKPLP